MNLLDISVLPVIGKPIGSTISLVITISPFKTFTTAKSRLLPRVGNSVPACSATMKAAYQSDHSRREDTQAGFADAVKVAAFFLTNSCTLSGACPVSVSTSFDIRS